jgi:hypothetical protein
METICNILIFNGIIPQLTLYQENEYHKPIHPAGTTEVSASVTSLNQLKEMALRWKFQVKIPICGSSFKIKSFVFKHKHLNIFGMLLRNKVLKINNLTHIYTCSKMLAKHFTATK